jgi:protease-4
MVALAAIGGTAWLATRGTSLTAPGDYVARIKIEGLIRNNSERTEALEKLARSRAKAVIVHIDSPGGTTAGSEQLYHSLRDLQARKPMVVVVDGLAASGAYIAALSADHIVASDTSLVGSIGVLFQYPNFSGALKTLGVQVEEIKSSPLKAAPNGYEPTSPEARAAIESIVRDSYAWFKELVQTRRRMNDAELTQVSDGRVFTGRQALPLKLVDALGNEKTARGWLASARQVSANLPARDVALSQRFGDFSFLHLAVWGLDALGFSTLARQFDQWGGAAAAQRLNLDGLLALWHPPASQ